MLIIGYQGVPGSYSEIGVIDYFGEDHEYKSYDSFKEMIADLASQKIDYCLLPVENSTTGAITRALDLVKQYPVFMVGECYVKVNHCLITLPGVQFTDIKTVYSHPEALKQCDEFFEKHDHIHKVAYLDTAKSVAHIKSLNDPLIGAIASKRAAQLYNLQILMENMQDNQYNTTRFAVLSHKEIYKAEADAISVYLVTDHISGSLFKVIKVFSDYQVNMLKIESRPIPDKPFNYGFYIDFEGNLRTQVTQEVIEQLEEHCVYLKVMGNYKQQHYDSLSDN